jgi:hypothetical protein
MQANSSAQIKNNGGKVGTYAISTINFDSWINEPSSTCARSKKLREAKCIINKIFAECAQTQTIVTDPFWLEKFNMAAIGKFPRCFSFHDGILTYRKSNKIQTVNVPETPEEAAHRCLEFFKVNGAIFSPKDKQYTQERQYLRSQSASQQASLTWGDANKKTQQCLLNRFVTDMKEIMTLNYKESENLRQTINGGISNKYFTKTNIYVERNRIHKIDGLLWDSNLRSFYIDPEIKPTVSRSYNRNKEHESDETEQKDTVPQFLFKWCKYADYLNKRLIQYNTRYRNKVILSGNNSSVRLIITDSAATSPRSRTSPTSEESEDSISYNSDYDNSDEDSEY